MDTQTNIVKRTDTNIKAICKVMCECDFVSAYDIAHYAQIAGFKPNFSKDGEQYFKFAKKYSKSNYCDALAKVLYIEQPETIERDKVIADFDFFLNSFGEISHTAMQYSTGLESVLKLIPEWTKNLPAGLKDTEEST